MRASVRIQLFDRQAEAVAHPARELLLGSDGTRCGKSHTLRLAALHACTKRSKSRVLLLQLQEQQLRRNHLEGKTGLLALVAEIQRSTGAADNVTVTPSEVRFGNGSRIRWSGCAREAEIAALIEEPFDVLLIDDAEEIPKSLFERLRERVNQSSSPSRRLICASRNPHQGWLREHWRGDASAERAYLEFRPEDLPAELQEHEGRPLYRDFVAQLHGPSWIWAPPALAIAEAIQKWLDNEFENLAVFIPSQHGKTTAGPLTAVPYILNHVAPTAWCSLSTYNQDKADELSEAARENYVRAGGDLSFGRRRLRRWGTLAGGGCWAAGTKGGQLGRPASYSFIDDGDEGWEDAISASSQPLKRRWYSSKLRSRESMYAGETLRQKICITNTRWDHTDLAGYILEKGQESGEDWGILVMPALYDPAIADGYREIYPEFTILDDWREEVGEPIWPERRNKDEWERARRMRGPLIFDSECQQNPRGGQSGGVLHASWFKPIDRDPAYATEEPNESVYAISCRAWDLAGTEGAGDWTAGVKMGRTPFGPVIVRHAVRAQLSPRGYQQLIAAMMILDGPKVRIRLPVDPNQGGIAAAEATVRYLRIVAQKVGMPFPNIVCEKPRATRSSTESAKKVRSRDFQSYAQPPDWKEGKDSEGNEYEPKIPGGVSYVNAEWSPSLSNLIEDYSQKVKDWPELREIAEKAALAGGRWWVPWLRELQSFTGDDNREDDQVDATVDAFDEVYAPRKQVFSGGMTQVWSRS